VFWAALALVLIGGVLSGTVVTLLFLPALCAQRAGRDSNPRPPSLENLVLDGSQGGDQAQPEHSAKHRQNENSPANPACCGGADGTRTYNLRL